MENIEKLNLNYQPTVLVDTSDMTEKEWLKWRTTGIGGSDAATLLNANPYATPLSLWLTKTGREKLLERGKKPDAWVAFAYGHALEQLVADIFADQTGWTVKEIKKMFRHPLYPFMQANVDRFIYRDVKQSDGSIKKEVMILECKTCSINNKFKWENNGIPRNYEIQVRHYMAVMNIDKAYIACLWDNNSQSFCYREIVRDLEFERMLVGAEKAFWEKNVVNDQRPALVGNVEKNFSCLREINSQKPRKKLERLRPQLSINAARWLELKAQKAELEKQKKAVEEEMKRISLPIVDELGTATESMIDDGENKFFISNKLGGVKEDIDQKGKEKLKLNEPEIWQKYAIKKEGSFRFSIKGGK